MKEGASLSVRTFQLRTGHEGPDGA